MTVHRGSSLLPSTASDRGQQAKDLANRYRRELEKLAYLFDQHDSWAQELYKENALLRSRCQEEGNIECEASRKKSVTMSEDLEEQLECEATSLTQGQSRQHPLDRSGDDAFQEAPSLVLAIERNFLEKGHHGHHNAHYGIGEMTKATNGQSSKQISNLSQSTDQFEEMEEAIRSFGCIDRDNTGLVSMENLMYTIGTDAVDLCMEDLGDAIMNINKLLGPRHKGSSDEISIETFKMAMLMSRTDLELHIGLKNAEAIFQMRAICAKFNLKTKISKIVRVSSEELAAMREQSKKLDLCVSVGEPFIAAIIILNSLFIGVSLDVHPDWPGWEVVESTFALIFVMELCVRVYVYGFYQHFSGADWAWNWFDFTFVIISICDFLSHLFAAFPLAGDAYTVSVIRILRLLRIFRLARLIRFKQFKELSLMLSGLLAGMRTMFWAMVFLVGVVYIIGVILRQLMNPQESKYDCDRYVETPYHLRNDFFADGAACNRGAYKINEYGELMCSSVSRSMTLIFTCLTDGCNAPDGTPMVWIWLESNGPLLVMGYTFVYVIVTFGIFNLVLAIFVENTMRDAHLDRHIRSSRAKAKKRLQSADKMQTLLVKICTNNDPAVNTLKKPKQACVCGNVFKDDSVFCRKCGAKRPKDGGFFGRFKRRFSNPNNDNSLDSEHLDMHVSRATFEHAVENSREIQLLLDDLEVSYSCRENIFDILDADGSGFLSLSEIADGIMRLRGGQVEKGDAVSCVLMVRSLQKRLRRFEEKTQADNIAILNAVKERDEDHRELDNRLRIPPSTGMVLTNL